MSNTIVQRKSSHQPQPSMRHLENKQRILQQARQDRSARPQAKNISFKSQSVGGGGLQLRQAFSPEQPKISTNIYQQLQSQYSSSFRMPLKGNGAVKHRKLTTEVVSFNKSGGFQSQNSSTQEKINSEYTDLKNRFTVPVEYVQSEAPIGNHLLQSEHQNTIRSFHQQEVSPVSKFNYTPI